MTTDTKRAPTPGAIRAAQAFAKVSSLVRGFMGYPKPNDTMVYELATIIDANTGAGELLKALEAIKIGLNVRRNRMGKLESDPLASEPLRLLAVKYNVGGCEDIADQAVKVAEAAIRHAKGE